jgi:hypothetical protein
MSEPERMERTSNRGKRLRKPGQTVEERQRERQRQYYADRREHYKQRRRAWVAANREEYTATARRYYQKNKGVIREIRCKFFFEDFL